MGVVTGVVGAAAGAGVGVGAGTEDVGDGVGVPWYVASIAPISNVIDGCSFLDSVFALVDDLDKTRPYVESKS